MTRNKNKPVPLDVTRVLPPWILGYRRRALRGDVVAGITVAVLLIPQALAYATLAGVPPVTGLYASLAALFGYALLGSSRLLAVGPVAMTALLVGAGLAPLADPADPRAVELAGLLALMVGGLQILMRLMRLGAVVNFLSHSVLTGFTAAAVLLIASTQVRDLFGLSVRPPTTQSVVDIAAAILPRLGEAHRLTVFVSLLSITVLLVGQRINGRFPVPLLLMIAATSASAWLRLDELGVAVLREVPRGLPAPRLPIVELDRARVLLPIAATIALVSFMEAIGNAKLMAARTRVPISPARELVAIGGINVASAAFGGFPVGGSFSRTALNAQAGAHTQMAGLVAALMLMLVVVMFTPLLYSLPRAVLAAIVIVAVLRLVDVKEMRSIWRIRHVDGLAVLVTFVTTLALGVAAGIGMGVGFSLLAFVVRSANPRIVELGRVEGTDHLFRDVHRYGASARTDPSVAILRMDAPLYFANARFLADRIEAIVASRPGLRHVLLDAASWSDVDAEGARTLRALYEELNESSVELHLVTLRGFARDLIGRAGLFEMLLAQRRVWSDLREALAALELPAESPLHRNAAIEQRPTRVF